MTACAGWCSVALYAGVAGDSSMVKDTVAEVTEYRRIVPRSDWRAGRADAAGDGEASRSMASKAPLDAYINSATALVGKVNNGDVAGATADLPTFDESFSALEGEMSAVSDAIEAANVDQLRAAERNALLSDIATWGGLVLILGLALATMLLAQRFVAKPLANMTEGFRRLSEGDLEVTGDSNHKVAEVNGLGKVLGIFREALRNREVLAGEAAATAKVTVARADAAAALNREIGDAVGAALEGDFSRRVSSEFADADLMELAHSVNQLIETVDTHDRRDRAGAGGAGASRPDASAWKATIRGR